MKGVLALAKPMSLTRQRGNGDLAACPGTGESWPVWMAATQDVRSYATSLAHGRKRRRRVTQCGRAAIEARQDRTGPQWGRVEI